jgi:hypothetical protein
VAPHGIKRPRRGAYLPDPSTPVGVDAFLSDFFGGDFLVGGELMGSRSILTSSRCT